MKIQYLDNYDEELLEVENSYMPQIGNSVFIGNTDEWIVQKIYWNADSNTGVVILKLVEDIFYKKEEVTDYSSRLREMDSAILETNKRLDSADKKVSQSRDQVSSLRSYIRRNTPKSKESP